MLEFCVYLVVFCALEFIFLTLWIDEIIYQWFYFKLFLQTSFVVVLWLLHFGTKGFGVSWTYNGKEGEMYLNPIGE